jgi:hypothetical protein
MAELSRVHGSPVTKALAEFDAPRGADEPSQRRAVRENGRCRIWPVMGLALLAFASAGARAQQTPTAPVGDIFESGAPQPVEQAFQKLYQITAQITANPSSFYLQAQVDKSNWPAVDQAQAQWDAAMNQSGTALTQDQRNNILPCVVHLNAAISDMERGFVIQKTQQSNPPAQNQAQLLYGEAKDEFAKCLATGIVTDNGSAPGSNGGTPATNTPGTEGGSTPGPESGGTPGTEGGGTPGTEAGGTPGTTQQPPVQPLEAAAASGDCSSLGNGGYLYCAKVSNDNSATCDCEQPIALPAQTPCGGLLQRALKLPKFSAAQTKQIQSDLANAKAMLLKAKAHVDAWDRAAQAVSATYFGTGDQSNQQFMSDVINEELTLIGNISDVSKNIFTDMYPHDNTRPKNLTDSVVSYVSAENAFISEPNPIIFLLPLFFKQSADEQARFIVHELSHLPYAGGSKDLAYDPINCRILAFNANVARLSPPPNVLPEVSPVTAPLRNADSISYFVHDLAQQ